jgi:hypothetical protein
MMPMLNRSRAGQKGGRKICWETEGQDAVFLFGQEFCGELEGLTKAEKYENDARYLQSNKQGFYKRIYEDIVQVFSFPTGFPSERFRTKCLHYNDEVQGVGAAQIAFSGAAAAAAALTGQSARVAVNKKTAAAQYKSVATPRRGNRKKQVLFNLSPPPLEDANDNDAYNIEEDPDYELDADLDDIALKTEDVSLISKESAIDSICRHGKISNSFEQEVASEEGSDDEVLCISVPRLKSKAQVDNMGFIVQYTHMVEYPNDIVYIIVYLIVGCAPSFFVSNKDEKSVWMVESHPPLYMMQLKCINRWGYLKLLVMSCFYKLKRTRKKRQQKKKCRSMTLIWESLHRGRLKRSPSVQAPLQC